ERISSESGWAPTGAGGGTPAQAAATSRLNAMRDRTARRIGRASFSTKPDERRVKSGGALAAAALARGRDGALRALAARGAVVRGLFLVEQRGELLHHGAAQLVGIDDRDGAAVVAGHVVADADGDQLDRRARLDPVDDVAQVALQVVARVHRQGG